MKKIYSLLLIIISIPSKAQDSIIYNSDFTFKDGVYKTFNEFKANNPSIKRDIIVTNERMLKIDSYFDNDRIFYSDKDGNKQKLSGDSIWGYCYNGIVYIYFKRKFQRLRMVGSITHFLALQNKWGYDPSIPQTQANKPYKEDPYMLDFKTGKIYKYNLENFRLILCRDQKLYTEFIALKRDGKMKKQMFIYLRKYNEKHPVYFMDL